MLNGLNIDQWVMARDRYRLNRLRKDKKANTAEIEKLFEQSNAKVRQRFERLPKIKLNQDLPVTQYADRLIERFKSIRSLLWLVKQVQGKLLSSLKLQC